MLVLCMYVYAANSEMLSFLLLVVFINNSLNRQLSLRVEVLNHMGWYLGHTCAHKNRGSMETAGPP